MKTDQWRRTGKYKPDPARAQPKCKVCGNEWDSTDDPQTNLCSTCWHWCDECIGCGTEICGTDDRDRLLCENCVALNVRHNGLFDGVVAMEKLRRKIGDKDMEEMDQMLTHRKCICGKFIDSKCDKVTEDGIEWYVCGKCAMQYEVVDGDN